MNFTATIIADFLKGTVEGNPDAVVNDVTKIEEGRSGWPTPNMRNTSMIPNLPLSLSIMILSLKKS